MSKKKVLLCGPMGTMSGYGTHARQVASWLMKKDVELKFVMTPWGDTPWCLDERAFGGQVAKMFESAIDQKEAIDFNADLHIGVQLPNEWNRAFGKKNVGVTAAIETDRCNPEWVQHCNKMDAIVVPSKHAAKSLTNTGAVVSPIHVVPESFYEECLLPQEETPSVLKLDTSFNFLVFGQISGNNPFNDRKNTMFAVKWLCEAFEGDKDVSIVLKTNLGRNTRIDRQNVTNLLNQLVKEVRKGPFPHIKLVHGDMTNREVVSLYRDPRIKALVSLTRGEGFGLPILEAAACGLPVVSTNWGGHLDFMDKGKHVGVSYQLNPIHQSRVDGKLFMPNARWAEASEQDFKKRITKFRSSPGVPREWAQDLQKTLHKEYSQESVERAYDEALGGFFK